MRSAGETTTPLWTWGGNRRGQLGDGSTDPSLNPEPVGSGAYEGVAAGDQFTFALSSTAADAPSAPDNITASASPGAATVIWDHADDNGSPVTSYTVTTSPGGSSTVVAGTRTAAVISGLQNGNTYSFTVRATNAVGDGPESESTASIVVSDPTNTPTGVSAAAGDKQVSVSWDDVATADAPVASYTVTAAPGGATALVPGSQTNAVVAGLVNGSAYTFTVHATNDVGDSAESASTAPITPFGVPGQPTLVNAVSGDASASITWTPTSANGSPVLSWTVVAYLEAPGPPVVVASVTVPPAPTSATVHGLTNGSIYLLVVHGTNAAGDGAGGPANNLVIPYGVPAAPANVVATSGNAQATVSWSAPAVDGGPGVTGSIVTPYIAGVAQPAQTFSLNGITQTITGLTNGVIYTFKVAAINPRGTGPQSMATAPIKVGTPVAPTATQVSSLVTTAATGSLRVSYVAPANAGSPITRFTATCVSSNGGATKTGVHVGSTAVAIIVSGVATKKSYTCTVRASNARGVGAPSIAPLAVIVGAPAAPTAVHAVRVAAGSLTVTFTPGANNGAAVTTFTATCTPVDTGVTKSRASTAHVITVSGLTSGAAYRCVVKATNSRGTGHPSAASPVVTA